MPLVAFALEQLFDRRSGNALSEDVYNELGGIAGAIGVHVDAVENQIAKEFGAGADTGFLKEYSTACCHQHRWSTHAARN